MDDADPARALPGSEAWLASTAWPESSADRTARYLRSLIFSGQLRPGDRLPAGRDLAGQLGISRITLTIGLKMLEAEGYVEVRKGARGGPRVRDAAALVRCWQDWARRNTHELDDIFSFRATIETRIAALAAELRSPAELARIEAAEAMYGETRDSLFRWDVSFHDAVAEAAHSPRLQRAMMAVRGELFLPVDQALLEHSSSAVHASHEAIVVAIRDADPLGAAEQMRGHVEDVRTMVLRALADQRG